jgi:ribonuclease HI
MKKVDLYTDGACSGNPGAGGWAAILIYNGNEKILSGGELETTNNKMEILSVIKGLEALKEKCEVTVYSDSQYLVAPFLEGYIDSWILLANVIINIEGVVVKPCKREDLLKSKCCNRG